MAIIKSHLWEMNELRRKLEQNENKPAPLNMWHFYYSAPLWQQQTGFYLQFRQNKKPVMEYYYQAVARGPDGQVMGSWTNLQSYDSIITMCNMRFTSGASLDTRLHGDTTYYMRSPSESGYSELTYALGTNGNIGMIFADDWILYVLMQPVNSRNANNRDIIELVGLNLDYPKDVSVKPPSRD